MLETKPIKFITMQEAVHLVVQQFQPLNREEIIKRLSGMHFAEGMLTEQILTGILSKLIAGGMIMQEQLKWSIRMAE